MININDFQPMPEILKYSPPVRPASSAKNIVDSFSSILNHGIQRVNTLESQSDVLTQMLVSGEIENIHDVMIAAEKAEVAINLTMNIRDKAIRAYDEIMAMGSR
ncbi:MAG: flagellar hook-basal body complex protein FliE [bacterium]|nr:flagellar hook-basal body complex protein FliE [bacterium]